ncbi:MAG: superinfection immunity protein [Verrucomicrobiota bacterium]|nr:superinfection immunity protein [Verrucomicrobiota bacterium]
MDSSFYFLLLFGFIIYMIPTSIAAQPKIANGGGVLFVNLIFGWTVIGWLAAFIWACVDKPRAEREEARCRFCAESIKPAAKVCRHCQRHNPIALEAAPIAKAQIESPKQISARLQPSEDEFAKWQREQSSAPSSN